MSAALTGSLVFLVAGSLLGSAATALVGFCSAALRRSVEPRDPGLVVDEALSGLLGLSVPLVGAAAATAIVVAGIQAGGVFTTKRLLPDLGKLSPIAGLQGLFSAQRLFQVARALFAAVLTLFLLRARLRDHLGDFAATLGSPAKAAVVAGVLCKALLRDVALLLCALALADVLFTRRAYFAKLRMSKDEVKREHKESEGDPHLKHAREQAHHEMMSQASMTAVRSATVVVVNPTHVAAALRYRDGEDDAPEIVAKGEGAHAQLIIETARAAGVPVVRDIPLARALVELEEGETIPEALYEATAEVLRAIAETDEGLTLVRGPPHGHADTSPTVWEMPAESV